ncbi:MAG: dienelactone hydrolase family protein [Acidimicrobiales bacterium]|nr:dienelactone hydrolase family protein [Acidimicrobiales bacterium]
MQTESIHLSTADGSMRCYVAAPDDQASTAVIVIQEAFGVNGHIEDVTRRVADAGHFAIAPDLFHRANDGQGAVVDYGDMEAVFALMGGVTDDGILVDVDAVLAELDRRGFPADRVGIVGFCMGGRVTFLVSARRSLGAGVGFYGGAIVTDGFTPGMPKLLDEAPGLRTPWLGLFGDQDQMIPIEGVEQLRALAAGATVDTDVVRYADADHGFHCNERPSYNADASADAWARTLAWFDAHLAS